MKVQASSIEVVYEVNFGSPAFDLITNIGGTVRSFCGNIAPRYLIKSEDIRTINSPVVEDIKIKIAMFNRNARIELSADKMVVSFQALTRPDIKIVEDCLQLISTALGECAKDVPISQEKIAVSVFFKTDSSVDEVKAYFGRHVQQDQLLKDAVADFANDRAESAIRLTLVEPNQIAVTTFEFAPAWRAPDLLMTVGCYFHPPFDAALAAKVDYVKSKITWFWSKIDLQISAE